MKIDLKMFCKDKTSLQSFLAFALKNKIYDTELFLTSTKDLDDNNVLMKALIYNLNSELDALVPHLEPAVYNYKNKYDLTFAQHYLIDRVHDERSFKIIESMWKKNKSAFCVKNKVFDPLEIFNKYTDRHLEKKYAGVKTLLWDMVAFYPEKVYQMKNIKAFISDYGVNPFLDVDYSAAQNKLHGLFFAVHEPVAKRTHGSILQSYKPITQDDIDVLNKLLGLKLNKEAKYASSFMHSVLNCDTDRNEIYTAFLDTMALNPDLIPMLSLGASSPSQDTYFHKFILNQVTARHQCVETENKADIKMLDFLLDHCPHLNTKNIDKLDPYEFAKKNNLNNTAQIIAAYIERKIMTSSLKGVALSEKPRKSLSKI